MSPLRWIVLFVGLALVGALLVGFSLPLDWEITTPDVVMPVPASDVEPYLLDLTRWKEWAIPEGVAGSWEFEGAKSGVGAICTFESDRAGLRRVLITAVNEVDEPVSAKVITYSLGVGDAGDPAEGKFTLSERDGNGVVQWELAGRVPDGMLSGFGALNAKLQGPRDLQLGLERLKNALLDAESADE